MTAPGASAAFAGAGRDGERPWIGGADSGGDAAAVFRQGGSMASRRFALPFGWLFACCLDWLFGIRRRGSRLIRLGADDCARAILPTSPRPLEVCL